MLEIWLFQLIIQAILIISIVINNKKVMAIINEVMLFMIVRQQNLKIQHVPRVPALQIILQLIMQHYNHYRIKLMVKLKLDICQ